MYKVVEIWPGQTVTCLHTNSPGHIWTTLYIFFLGTRYYTQYQNETAGRESLYTAHPKAVISYQKELSRWITTILGARYAVSWAIIFDIHRPVPLCQTFFLSFHSPVLYPQSVVHFTMKRQSSLSYKSRSLRLMLLSFRFGDCRDQGLIVCHSSVRTALSDMELGRDFLNNINF
jgi:hypothetical protein